MNDHINIWLVSHQMHAYTIYMCICIIHQMPSFTVPRFQYFYVYTCPRQRQDQVNRHDIPIAFKMSEPERANEKEKNMVGWLICWLVDWLIAEYRENHAKDMKNI